MPSASTATVPWGQCFSSSPSAVSTMRCSDYKGTQMASWHPGGHLTAPLDCSRTHAYTCGTINEGCWIGVGCYRTGTDYKGSPLVTRIGGLTMWMVDPEGSARVNTVWWKYHLCACVSSCTSASVYAKQKRVICSCHWCSNGTSGWRIQMGAPTGVCARLIRWAIEGRDGGQDTGHRWAWVDGNPRRFPTRLHSLHSEARR